MKNNLLLPCVVVLLLIGACKKNDRNSPPENDRASRDLISTKASKLPEQFIENDSLTLHWEKELEKMVLSHSGFRSEDRLYTNIHDETIQDTVTTYTFKKSRMVFYKSRTFEAIISAEIRDASLKIADAIGLEMDKKQFEQYVGTPIKTNIVKVGNVEHTLVFTFRFSKNAIRSIDFEGYID